MFSSVFDNAFLATRKHRRNIDFSTNFFTALKKALYRIIIFINCSMFMTTQFVKC